MSTPIRARITAVRPNHVEVEGTTHGHTVQFHFLNDTVNEIPTKDCVVGKEGSIERQSVGVGSLPFFTPDR